MKKLQLDYLDLYLIHWPLGVCIDKAKWKYKQSPLYKVWADMETCVRKGLCKRIGVSNFNCQLLLDLLSYAEIQPFANQIELHPYCIKRKLVKYCLLNDITPIAYSPLLAPGGRKTPVNILEDPVLVSLVAKYKKAAPQICLQWGMTNGHVVILHTQTFSQLKENIESITFTIEPEDLKKIDQLDKTLRIYDPSIRGTLDEMPIFN